MCVTSNKQLLLELVSNEETYTRWIYLPRYGNSPDSLNTKFISLRENESGISGQILERAGHNLVLQWGLKFRRKNKDSKPNEERFIGYAKALVGSIRAVADEEGDKIDVIMTSSIVPFHAEIRFEIGGDCVVGNTQHPKFLKYKDKLKELLANDVCRVTLEELDEYKSSSID